MRSTIRSLTLAGLLVGTTMGATAADAQPARRRAAVQRTEIEPMRQRRLLARERAVAVRERAVVRRANAAGGQVNRRANVAGVDVNRRAARDRVVARRAVMRERIRNMTPEQRIAFQANRQAFRTERQAIGTQLRAGTITQEQARTRMRAWREQHPNGLRRPPREPGGEF